MVQECHSTMLSQNQVFTALFKSFKKNLGANAQTFHHLPKDGQMNTKNLSVILVKEVTWFVMQALYTLVMQCF